MKTSRDISARIAVVNLKRVRAVNSDSQYSLRLKCFSLMDRGVATEYAIRLVEQRREDMPA